MRCVRCGGPVWLDAEQAAWHCYHCGHLMAAEQWRVDRARVARKLTARSMGVCEGCGGRCAPYTVGTADGHRHYCGPCADARLEAIV